MARNLFCIFIAAFWTTVLFPVTLVVMVITLNPEGAMWVVTKVWAPVLLWAGGAQLCAGA